MHTFTCDYTDAELLDKLQKVVNAYQAIAELNAHGYYNMVSASLAHAWYDLSLSALARDLKEFPKLLKVG